MKGSGVQLACDVGGTSIKLALVDGAVILARTEIPAIPEQGLRGALPRIRSKLDYLCKLGDIRPDLVQGFAMAFPGIIDPETEQILSTPAGKFDDSKVLNAHAEIRNRFGLPAFIVNDANAALAGEWQFGSAHGCRSAVMMTLGTGVGSSAVIDGIPLRGIHGQAGCLGGHLTANVHGSVCRCGNLGCSETEASTWALPDRAREHPGFRDSALALEPLLDYRAIFKLAQKGDWLAGELEQTALRIWACTVVTLIHAYDPERVVLGGGLMQSGEVILPYIREHVARHAWTPWGTVEVVAAALGNEAGMLGAAWLATQKGSFSARPSSAQDFDSNPQ